MSDIKAKEAELLKNLEALNPLKEQEPEVIEAEPEVKAEASEAEATEDVLAKYNDEEREILKMWDPNGVKSADEFLRADPLYKEIAKRGKKLQALEEKLNLAMSHISNLQKAGYEEKLEMIKHERANAVARSDLESVDYLDEQLYKVKEEIKQVAPTPQHQLVPEAMAFLNKHEALIQDYSLEAMEIKAFIDKRDRELASFNLTPEVHFKTLEKDMKSKFPSRFGPKEAKEVISAVESDTQPVKRVNQTKSKLAFKDLDVDQKKMYRYMESRGYDTERYLKQLQDLNK